jgi:hypothetical protein
MNARGTSLSDQAMVADPCRAASTNLVELLFDGMGLSEHWLVHALWHDDLEACKR